MNRMMIRPGGSFPAAASAAALLLALAPAPLAAQSVDGYRLPGATVRPAPSGAQGPVDRDAPVVTTTVPRPTPAPSPAPSPAPAPAPNTSQPAATPSQTAAPGQPAGSRVAPRPAAARPGPVAAPSTTAPSPTATNPATLPPPAGLDPAIFPTTVPIAPPPAVSPLPAATATGWYWPWLAGLAALLALVFAGLWYRRTRDAQPLQLSFEHPVVPAPVAKPVPQPFKPAAAAPLPQPQLPIVLPTGLGMTLEARRLNASLMATTLSYVLTLTNTGTEALSALAVEGDMISAHASLPPEAQIANDNQRLELRHAVVALAPGESCEFTGDFRLPLTLVTPIRAGDAAYFVPLARLRVEASTPSGGSLVQVQTYVVGELPEAPGAALRPFRLDLGPRTYSRVGQRAVI